MRKEEGERGREKGKERGKTLVMDGKAGREGHIGGMPAIINMINLLYDMQTVGVSTQ